MNACEVSTLVKAPASVVWSRLSAVCDWPGWLPTVVSVAPLDGRSLALGHKYRVEQPRLRPAIWTVSGITPGESFLWESRSPGVVTTAEHRVARVSDRECTVLLRVAFRGLLAPLVFRMAGRLTREYIGREAQALRAATEGPDGAG